MDETNLPRSPRGAMIAALVCGAAAVIAGLLGAAGIAAVLGAAMFILLLLSAPW